MANTSTESMMSTHFWEPQWKLGPIESDCKRAIGDIVSQEFAARLNVVSGLTSFLQAVGAEPSVVTLYKAMTTSHAAIEDILKQIKDLSNLEVDRRYENPNDTALAVFLLLVTLVDIDYAFITADLVDRAPQCWYAKKIARRILTPSIISSSNTKSYLPYFSHTVQLSNEMTIVINPATHLRTLSFSRKTNVGKNEDSSMAPEVFTWR